MNAEQKIKELELKLTNAPAPMGLYKPVLVVGNMAYLSGHGPLHDDKTLVTGRLGFDMDVKEGYEAARLTGRSMLSSLNLHLGSLNKVKRLVKLVGLVRSTNGFNQQPAVINGCSELMRDVFGDDAGVGARSAIGVKALPANMAVEIEAIFEIEVE